MRERQQKHIVLAFIAALAIPAGLFAFALDSNFGMALVAVVAGIFVLANT